MTANDALRLAVAVLLAVFSRHRPALAGAALMGLNDVAQLIILIVALAVAIPLLGGYMAQVSRAAAAPGDRSSLRLERLIYRLCGSGTKRSCRLDLRLPPGEVARQHREADRVPARSGLLAPKTSNANFTTTG